MKKKSLKPLLLISTVSLLLLFSFCKSTDNPAVSFNDDILPIFKARCVGCHSSDASFGNLNLSTYESLMSGNSNHPDRLVVAGDPYQSLLYESVAYEIPQTLTYRMPKDSPYLQGIEIKLIEDWIYQGAKDN